ncbi:hypothetical protein A9Q99_19040 [Gammaproteobacteria bacterium 45_16_T64]|nr:hypothetical protein A9Q99_19040 [Gammaproteobacteria bacterium 45_16_T64]
MKTLIGVLTSILLILSLTACGGSSGGGSSDTPRNASDDSEEGTEDNSNPPSEPDNESPEADLSELLLSCEQGNRAIAGQISNPNFKLTGPNAIGGEGDYLIANDKAAFVITGPGPQKTYYHYHGILVDAAPLSECEQAGNENFYEMALMIGRLNFFTQSASTIRAFKGGDIEVLNDGSDGSAAIVRVHGSDSIYWLLELELIQRAFEDGLPKGVSSPFGLDITLDYVLEPGSSTLKIVYRVKNQLNQFNSVSAAFAMLAAGEGPTLNTFSGFDLNLEGLELQYGIPWVTSFSKGSSYVYGAGSNQLTTTHIAGVDALIDASQLSNTWLGQLLAPAGDEKDTFTKEFYVSVASNDEVGAINEYLASSPPSVTTLATPVSALIVDAVTGAPIPDATIEFQTKTQVLLQSWPWNTFASTFVDENGLSTSTIPLISYLQGQPYRAIARAPGRATTQPIEITPSQANTLLFEMGQKGVVAYNITDETGQALPAQISFWQHGSLIQRHYVPAGTGVLPVPPGDYEVGIARGFEYGIVDMPLQVSANNQTPLVVSLKRMVDTSGYMSFDAHVHSSPSADSEVAPEDRITTAAATGLEIVVSTDHEIVTDLYPAVENTNLTDWVSTVIGQEVTATLPNHTITYPIPKHDDIPRGDPVRWYGLDIAGIFAAEKARGAQISTFAHPRSSYLNHIEWDRIAGAPAANPLVDLGLPADGTVWSWDFEAMEYQNGPSNVFTSGLFEDWMSFLNHGHRITATGASDVHGDEPPGMPRTYFRSPTDSPAEFDEQDLVDAVKNNQAIVSTGAFATIIANDTTHIGGIVSDSDGTIDLSVHVQAIPQIDIDYIKIYVNCDEAMRIDAENPTDSAVKLDATLQVTVPKDKDAHIVLLGFGANKMPRELPQYAPEGAPRVTTNPIFIDANNNGQFDAPGGKTCALLD